MNNMAAQCKLYKKWLKTLFKLWITKDKTVLNIYGIRESFELQDDDLTEMGLEEILGIGFSEE